VSLDAPPPRALLFATIVALTTGLLALGQTVNAAAPLGARLSLLLGQVALLAPFLILVLLARLHPGRTLGLAPVPARTLALSLASGCGFWVASAGLLESQAFFWPPPPEVVETFRRLHDEIRPTGAASALASILCLAAAPALAEEIAFRGALLGALRPFASPGLTVVVSAAAFGAIHIWPGGYRVPFAFALGLALGALRVRTGSIVPAVVAHGVVNTITLFLAQELDTADAAPSAGAALALLAVGTVLSVATVRAMPRVVSPAP
jgi:membrane protease YdiL (CAAX protease family)